MKPPNYFAQRVRMAKHYDYKKQRASTHPVYVCGFRFPSRVAFAKFVRVSVKSIIYHEKKGKTPKQILDHYGMRSWYDPYHKDDRPS